MNDWKKEREKIIGLGEQSFRKSYYPELQTKIEELEHSQRNLDNILKSMADAVVIHRKNGEFLYANQNALELFNIEESDVRNFSIYDLSSYRMDPNEIPVFLNRVTVEKSLTIEWIACQHASNKEIPVQVKMSYISWNGEPALISVLRDFTVRKRFETELIKARHRAEESDRLKSAFLANVSHEIRTPLNGILGFSSLLRDISLTFEDRLSFVDVIEKGGHRLLNIINQVMDISKIEAGTVELEIGDVNINEKLRYIQSLFIQEAKNKGLNLILKIPDFNKFYISTDEEKLEAVITNLVRNSIKFSKKGTIEFGYNLHDSNLHFFVKDEGIGIPQNRQNAIFKRFVQADPEDKNAYQGAGLGLSISKAYLEMLGTHFELESKIGEGSVFSFKLPAFAKETNVKEIIKPALVYDLSEMKQIKVLIVEDDKTSELLLKNALKRYSTQMMYAGNGIKAVEICRENSNIDIVFMDVRLPGMSGFDASKKIREFNKDIIIVAQTAHAMTGDKEKAISFGCNDYISKPIKLSELKNLLGKYFTKK